MDEMAPIASPQAPLRSPDTVMRLARMGASFPTRLSFLPTLLRQLRDEGAEVTRPVWEIGPEGYGHAVYSVPLGGHVYSLVAISSPLEADQRTDRVIATAWDTAYVLYDGVPDASEIARLCDAAPLQEAGRFTERDLVLSRANRSVRLFDHVVEALRKGNQPDADRICDTGYLMRTTAVYGNGKFGIADRTHIAQRPGLSGPFMAEMLTVWLIRGFTHDLVEHLGGRPLDRRLKRHLGIGNATGLGMAPFLVSHPLLLDAWMQVRETALARVRAAGALSAARRARYQELAQRVVRHLAQWSVPDAQAQANIETLQDEWQAFSTALPGLLDGETPTEQMYHASLTGSLELQELTVAFLLEPFGELVDGLTCCMATPAEPRLKPGMSITDLKSALQSDWSWALDLDFADPTATHQFWYVSESKAEPRLGLRHEEPGAERESPLDIARQVQDLAGDLPRSGSLAEFLMAHPHHRAAVRRVQSLMRHPYAEIRDNLIDADCRPIDMLRCKLAFFGAARFDPKSDRWTRITLAQGAPLADELDRADDWWLPAFGDE